jgi:predicted transcriptional regulator YdeE
MHTIQEVEGIRVVGLKLRTTNEKAFEAIPAHWKKFFEEGTPSRIKSPLSETVYAVYTDFENQGVNNEGIYSFIVGMRVSDTEPVPAGLAAVSVPASRRAVFPVEQGHPERVGDQWRKIWSQTGLPKSYVCDYEQYDKDGQINIFVGLR